MDSEMAKSLLEHFVAELERFGFGEVNRLVRTHLEESAESYELNLKDNRGYQLQLKIYLEQAIDILENISSASLPKTVERLARHVSGNVLIEDITIETINGQEISLYSLPNYDNLISSLKEIYQEIIEEL